MRRTLAPFFALLLSGCAAMSGDSAYKRGDLDEAARIWADAAEAGDATAALKLGDLHANYVVETGGEDRPLPWYERACKLGNAEGCHNAGLAYQYAQGTQKDVNKAYDYFMRAAKKGHVPSQYHVAGMVANDVVRTVNPIDGYKWMLRAQDQAQSRFVSDTVRRQVLMDADGTREKLEARLSADQRRRAAAEEKSWRPED